MVYRNITVVFLLFTLAAGPVLFFVAPSSASAQSSIGGCLEYELRWTTDPPDKPTSTPSRIKNPVPISPNPIKSGDPGFSSSTKPAIPSGVSSSEADWFCTKDARVASVTETTDDEALQGMEMCIKAAEISAKWGGFTTLNYVQEDLMKSMRGYLEKEIGGSLGIDLKLDAEGLAKTLVGSGVTLLKDKFKEAFGDKIVNPLKGEVQKKIDKIKENTIKKVEEKVSEFIYDKAKELAGKVGGGIAEAVLGSPVPVEDKELIKVTEAVKQRVGEVFAEQKRAQIVQKTREECSSLYKETIDTIKRSILYQFSTQITDWIVKDEKPQFIKNPGKFLEDTARLAVDRTISRIAPNLCEPFRLNVQIQIPTVAREANPFYEQVTCTLDQVTSNIENFYNNFRDGGWVAYQEMWKPQNNYFGAMMMIESELAAQQQAAFQAMQDDINRGQGFTSEKRCTQWMLYKKVDCPKPADGPVTASMRRSMRIDYMPSADDCYETSISAGDLPEDGGKPDLPPDAPSGSYYDCTGGEITTPGTLTSDLSKRAQQTDFDYISQMQSGDIENFLETIENAIINKLVKSGVKGLQNLLKGLPKMPEIKL